MITRYIFTPKLTSLWLVPFNLCSYQSTSMTFKNPQLNCESDMFILQNTHLSSDQLSIRAVF